MSNKDLFLKCFGFWGLFLILHYAYDFFPTPLVKLISGTDESFFQHLKISFFTYLMVNVIEYLVRRKNIEPGAFENFWYARLFSTLILPWFVFIIWYIAPAYYGRLPSLFLEILYSNIATILSVISVLILEQSMESTVYSKSLKTMIVTLFLVSLSLYIIFTFKQPWAGFFIDTYTGFAH